VECFTHRDGSLPRRIIRWFPEFTKPVKTPHYAFLQYILRLLTILDNTVHCRIDHLPNLSVRQQVRLLVSLATTTYDFIPVLNQGLIWCFCLYDDIIRKTLHAESKKISRHKKKATAWMRWLDSVARLTQYILS
ncbi:MAG: hypothetical protein RL220_1147, partial [Bacteroidota bacterium]